MLDLLPTAFPLSYSICYNPQIDLYIINVEKVKNKSFKSAISSFGRPSRSETKRLVDHLLLLLFKRNSTRGQLSYEVMVQHCLSSGLRLNDLTSNLFHLFQLFPTIVITIHMFKVIKYYWKARDQKSKSVLLVLPPDTTQNNPTSIISRVAIFFVFFLCATEFKGAHLPCSHVNLSAFLKHHSTYLQDNEKIELCGVYGVLWCGMRLHPNFWKWPAVKKVWPSLD